MLSSRAAVLFESTVDALDLRQVLDRDGSFAEILQQAVDRTTGVPEVSVSWVHAHQGRFRFVDVREAAELEAEGSFEHAEHLPLSVFLSDVGAAGVDAETPTVVTCRAGGRSVRAVQALLHAGFPHVASMAGGMMAWKAAGLPTR